jgi:hypothetical protein
MSKRPRPAVLAGRWTGVNRLWMSPDDPPRESPTRAVVAAAADGACATLEYTWAEGDRPHAGLMVLRHADEPGAQDVAWIDTFHTGGRFMMLDGETDARHRYAAMGRYSVPQSPEWGWRVVLEVEGPDRFALLMYNVAPDGQVYPAVEARYARDTD